MKIRLIAGVTVAIALLLAMVTATLGHAQLISSDPALGATIKTPYTLTATFDDELTLDGSSIVVDDSAGKTVASGTVSGTDDHTMTAQLPALPDGVYQVLWTAVSVDDKAVERGQYQFEVSATAASAAPTAAAPTAAASAVAATATPSAAATKPATISTPAPAPSAAPGSNTGSGNDLLLPLVAVIVIVVAMAGFLLYRNRRPEQP